LSIVPLQAGLLHLTFACVTGLTWEGDEAAADVMTSSSKAICLAVGPSILQATQTPHDEQKNML
jgi:hypothetical protein